MQGKKNSLKATRVSKGGKKKTKPNKTKQQTTKKQKKAPPQAKQPKH